MNMVLKNHPKYSSWFNDSAYISFRTRHSGGISAGVNLGKPCPISNVNRSVQVSWQYQTTFGTFMHPVRKRFRHNRTATATFLRGRVVRFTDMELSTSASNLVGKHVYEVTPRSVENISSEIIIFNQAVDIKIFNGNNTVVISNESAGFVEEVPPLVGNPFMLDSKLTNSLPTVITTFSFPRNQSMQSFQLSLGFLNVPWIIDDCVIGECCEVLKPDVNANGFIINGFNSGIGFNFTGEHDEPFTTFHSFDGHGFGFTSGDSMKNDWHIPDIGDMQFLIRNKFKTPLWIGNALEPLLVSGKPNLNPLTSFFFFNPTIEVRECFREPTSNILKHLGIDPFEIGIDFFKLSNDFIQIKFGKRCFISKIGILTNSQKLIKHFLSQKELHTQSRELLSRRIYSIFVISQFDHIHQNYIDLEVYIPIEEVTECTPIHPIDKSIDIHGGMT